MKRLAALVVLAALVFPAQAERRGYSVTNFDRIQVNGPFVVRLTTGGGATAYAEGSNHAINQISLQITGRTLRVRRNVSTSWGGYPGENADAGAILYLSTPSLEEATVIGAGNLQVDRMEGGRLVVSLGGNGQIRVGEVEADALALAITGAGTMEVGGHAETGRVTVQGPGTVNAAGLTVENLTVTLNGPGAVEITGERQAEVTAVGDGSVTVLGDVACIDRSVGSGQVSCGRFRAPH